jgi:hypothetical protein
LHTSRSLVYEQDAGLMFAVRLDEFPATPGLMFPPVVNVVAAGTPPPTDGLERVRALRYAWKNPEAIRQLPAILEGVVARVRTCGEYVAETSASVVKNPDLASSPKDPLPPELVSRLIGLRGP